MTTTTRIAATTAADSSYSFNVASGASTTFGCSGLAEGEEIKIQKKTASSFDDFYYEDPEGNNKEAILTWIKNTIRVSGPFDGRINKPVTAAAVEVVEYS